MHLFKRQIGSSVSYCCCGVHILEARYYDKQLGMFISPDPLIPDPTDIASYNRYLYANGNPIKYNDPSGHFVITATLVVGVVVLAGLTAASIPYYNYYFFQPGAEQHRADLGAAVDDLGNNIGTWLAPPQTTTNQESYPLSNSENGRIPGIELIPDSGQYLFPYPQSDLDTPNVLGDPLPEPASLGDYIYWSQGGSKYVGTPSGAVVRVPADWIGRETDNKKGVVFQKPGATSKNADSIRIMDPDTRYPNGCVRYYNSYGQPLDVNGKPGDRNSMHIPLDYRGPLDAWPE